MLPPSSVFVFAAWNWMGLLLFKLRPTFFRIFATRIRIDCKLVSSLVVMTKSMVVQSITFRLEVRFISRILQSGGLVLRTFLDFAMPTTRLGWRKKSAKNLLLKVGSHYFWEKRLRCAYTLTYGEKRLAASWLFWAILTLSNRLVLLYYVNVWYVSISGLFLWNH